MAKRGRFSSRKREDRESKERGKGCYDKYERLRETRCNLFEISSAEFSIFSFSTGSLRNIFCRYI